MKNLKRLLSVVFLFALFGSVEAGFVLLESSFSSAGSELSSGNFLLKQGMGQPVIGESNSSDYIEQAGFYNWLLYVSSGVGVKETNSKRGFPLVYRFSPPRPNPARENVTIVFEVPKKTRVTLKVYDAAGRIVKTILNEVKEPGRYRLNWYGKDDMGRMLPSGIYFLRMEGEGFKKTQKLMLM